MSAAANGLGKPETDLWEGLLDQWRQRVSAPIFTEGVMFQLFTLVRQYF
jgi:hypothetical protein